MSQPVFSRQLSNSHNLGFSEAFWALSTLKRILRLSAFRWIPITWVLGSFHMILWWSYGGRQKKGGSLRAGLWELYLSLSAIEKRWISHPRILCGPTQGFPLLTGPYLGAFALTNSLGPSWALNESTFFSRQLSNSHNLGFSEAFWALSKLNRILRLSAFWWVPKTLV